MIFVPQNSCDFFDLMTIPGATIPGYWVRMVFHSLWTVEVPLPCGPENLIRLGSLNVDASTDVGPGQSGAGRLRLGPDFISRKGFLRYFIYHFFLKMLVEDI